MLYNGIINGSNVVMRGSLGEIYEQFGLEYPAMNNAKDQTGNDVETAVVPRSKVRGSLDKLHRYSLLT